MANPNPISPWRDYVIQTEQVTVRDYHVRARSEEEALDRFLEGKAHLDHTTKRSERVIVTRPHRNHR